MQDLLKLLETRTKPFQQKLIYQSTPGLGSHRHPLFEAWILRDKLYDKSVTLGIFTDLPEAVKELKEFREQYYGEFSDTELPISE